MADNFWIIDGMSANLQFRSANVSGFHYPGHMIYDNTGNNVFGIADDAPVGTTNPLSIGAVYYSSNTGVDTTGDLGYLRMNQYRALCVQMTDTQGNFINPTSQNEDSGYDIGDPGLPILAVRDDQKNVRVSTDHDYGFLSMSSAGDLRVDGGQAYVITNSPTVTTGTYNVDTVLGGKQSLASASRSTGAGGIITGVTMIAEDDAADGWSAGDVEILVFHTNPAGSFTNNTAIETALSDADAALLIGTIVLDTKVALGNVSLLKAEQVNMSFINVGASTLYAVPINRGGKSPEATDALTFAWQFIRD